LEKQVVNHTISLYSDGRWLEVDPALLSCMIIQGRADMASPATDLSAPFSSARRGCLKDFLRLVHCESLSRQMLHYVQAMYKKGPKAVDACWLRDRIRELAVWDWPDTVFHARLLWLAAWLLEVTGLFEEAVKYYDAFIRLCSPETHLRLLAHNNRGVLLVRLGKVEGIEDLARCAILMELNEQPEPPTRLPEACLNLLTLLNCSAYSKMLRRQVEVALTGFVATLPSGIREQWIGPDPAHDMRQEDLCGASDRVEHNLRDPEVTSGSLSGCGKSSEFKRISTLEDPTFKRLNALTVELAAQAQYLAVSGGLQCEDSQQQGTFRLHLWGTNPHVSVAGSRVRDELPGSESEPQYSDYAGAASLLCPCDIPLSLEGRKDTALQAEQRAWAELDRAMRLSADGNGEAARCVLELQRQIVSAFSSDIRFVLVLRQIDSQLNELLQRRDAEQDTVWHRTCMDLMRDVDEFCRLSDLDKAQRGVETLRHRINEVQAKQQAVSCGKYSRLFADLSGRVTHHLLKLKDMDGRRRARQSLQKLYEFWPCTLAEAAPNAAYAVLASCQLSDPENRVEDWDLFRWRLDRHQALHHLYRALDKIVDRNIGAPDAERAVIRALTADPSLWPIGASLLCLFRLPSAEQKGEALEEIQTELLATVSQFLDAASSEADANTNPTAWQGLVRQTCYLLHRLFRVYECGGRKTGELWRGLEKSLEPTLASAEPEVLEQIEEMIDACLHGESHARDSSLGRLDPRNPLRMFQETCRKTRLLGQAEQLLNAQPPQLEGALEHFELVISTGLERTDQLQRAVDGLYLAHGGIRDMSRVQRWVLDQLDSWVARMTAKQRGWVRCDDVLAKIRQIKEQTGLAPREQQAASGPPSTVPAKTSEQGNH
jgi:hypothetical protein